MTKVFSIIMPVRNSERTLLQSLKSALGQDVDFDFEILAVISRSTDKSGLILDSISDTRLRIIRGEEKNAFEAMNSGIINSRGKYIVFLNSDDVFFSDKVLAQANAAIQESGPDLIYGDILMGDLSEKDFKVRRYWRSPIKLNTARLWRGFYPPHPGLILRRDFAMRIGPMPIDHPVVGDLFFIDKIISHKDCRSVYLKGVTVLMRMGGLSTRSKGSVIKHNVYIARKLCSQGRYIEALESLFLKPVNRLRQIWEGYVYSKRYTQGPHR